MHARIFKSVVLSAVLLSPSIGHAVRVWEEPHEAAVPTTAPGDSSVSAAIVSAFTGSAASPDLQPSNTLTPLAAGGHVGASRYPAGVAERWLDIGFFTQPRLAIQTGYNPDQSSNFSIPPSVSVRRTRIVVHGQAHPLLQVRIEFNISDRIELLDVYGLVPLHRMLHVQIGQFRVPFSRQELVSSTRLQFADGSLWSGGANGSGIRFIPSFDLGLMVWGWIGPGDLLEYYAGIFNGEGANQLQNQDGYFLYAGRLAVNPLGRPRSFQESAIGLSHSPRISIGLNAATQQRQIGLTTIDGNRVPNRLRAVSLGADLFASAYGASLYGEIYYRDLRETDTRAAPSTESFGWLVQLGYFIPAPYVRQHLEIVARIQDFDPSGCFTRSTEQDCGARTIASATPEIYRDFQHTTALTFGMNWYQTGHGFKIQASYQLNYEAKDIAGMPAGSGIVENDLFLLQVTGSF